MADTFNNPWFIGIGGGILSGLIVTFISRALLSRRDRREYIQKVLSANREVIYAIRPGISEGLIPTPEVVEALINATARKYGVDKKDVHDSDEVAQELIKEVMDSSFISARTKEEYCGKLADLSRREIAEERAPEYAPAIFEKEIRRTSSYEAYRARMIQMMSMMMGFLAAMMTIILAFSKSGLFDESLSINREKLTLLLPMLVSLLAVSLSVLFTYFYRDIIKKRDREKKKKPDETSDSSESTD
jgi:hypothetical protein